MLILIAIQRMYTKCAMCQHINNISYVLTTCLYISDLCYCTTHYIYIMQRYTKLCSAIHAPYNYTYIRWCICTYKVVLGCKHSECTCMAVYSLTHPQQPTSIRISVQLKRASGSELETTIGCTLGLRLQALVYRKLHRLYHI